jgi:predicted Zn-dependent protease
MTQASLASLVDRAGLDRARLERILARGFEGADDGELFLEYRQSEALTFDNGRLKQATFDTNQGFGLRAVKADAVGYAHASDLSQSALERAADAVRAVRGGYSGTYSDAPSRTNARLYGENNPIGSPSFEHKVRLLETERFIEQSRWQAGVDDAVRQALVNLESVPAPAGEMDVVLGPGWPGVMLHEAVGHGLEGDFNRKRTSAFAGLMGERVAAKGVTVVDDGTIAARRGSLTVDDEGTPTDHTVLIEDGILVGYMQDRQNARLMNMKPTGNGRRESYAHVPMPRMTNTYMLAGHHVPAEILASVKNGIYAVSFGGGQVDITSGKFVFQCTEAYRIENGKVGAPLKGAMLIGNGPDALTRVTMIGNDLELDAGIGTCGKNGQGVPVGVGQPTLRMDRITVGGTG